MKFPVFIDLQDRKIIVIGGGNIALRRIQTLLPFGGKITVISPGLHEDLLDLFHNHQIGWLKKEYAKGDCKQGYMVLACTNDRNVNYSVYKETKEMDCYRNNCDCKEESNFYFPGIASKGEIVVGITASGTNHHLAKSVTKKIQQELETNAWETKFSDYGKA